MKEVNPQEMANCRYKVEASHVCIANDNHNIVQNAPPHHLQADRPQRTEPSEAKFITYQERCNGLFGPAPSLRLALEHNDPLFHEAAVFVPGETTDSLFVTSNKHTPKGTGIETILISKLTRGRSNARKWQLENIPGCHELMGNGGVNYPATNSILFCAQGAPGHPSSLVTMAIDPPYTVQKLLTNFHGRLFNSLNDVVVARDGAIWFTDPTYGYEQEFRPQPQLPCQVYRFDPAQQDVRAVADGFGKPNGLCFSPDELTLYVTDTAWLQGNGQKDDMRASHIYAFTVQTSHGAPFLTNRRLFAMASVGIPDGIKCDNLGNVYSGCGDGINIWAPDGVLLGKILVPGGIANFCFGRPGELFLLNETRFWLARVEQSVSGALLPSLSVQLE